MGDELKLYGRSDIDTVSGDCSHTFKRALASTAWAPDRTVPVVECDDCTPTLLALGWKDDPRKVELTPDEQEGRDLAEKEGHALTNTMAHAFASQLSEQVNAAKSEQAKDSQRRAKSKGIEVPAA